MRTRTCTTLAMIIAISATLRISASVVPNVEPVSFFAFATGFTFGIVPGFLVGALSMILSDLVLSLGIWTVFTAFSMGLYGVTAGIIRRYRKKLVRIELGMYALLLTIVYGVITNLYWFLFIPGEKISFLLVLLAWIPFGVTHIVSNIVFFAGGMPRVLEILEKYT